MSNMIMRTSTGIFIYPYEKGQCKQLEYETSVEDRIRFKRIPHIGFFNETLGGFATYRMDESKIYNYLRWNFPGYSLVDRDVYKGRNLKFKFSMNVLPNKFQSDVLVKLMGNDKYEAFVNMPTASGKTLLAIMYLQMYDKKTIIICHSSAILNQWYKTLDEKTDMDMNRVLIVNSTSTFKRILDNEFEQDIDIYLCTTTLFDNFGTRHGYEKCQKLFENMGVGLKIIDEAHTRIGTTIRMNAYTSIGKTLYLSADYNQANDKLKRQFDFVFRHVPRMKLDDELMNELKHITAITCVFNSSPSPADVATITGGRYSWNHTKYSRYEFEKGMIIKVIDKILETIIEAEKDCETVYKVLILTQLIENVEDLYLPLKESMREYMTVDKFHSGISQDDKENALKADVIISTYKSFSTGIDVTNPEIKHVISTAPVDPVTANQSAGRCRPIKGQTSFFWMVQDYGFEYCSTNTQRVIKYLKTNKIGDTAQYIYEGDSFVRG